MIWRRKVKKQVDNLQAFGERLLEENNGLWEENAHLKDEVAVLKGEKKRPVFKPSRMNEEAGKADKAQEEGQKTAQARWINETKQDRATGDPLR